MRKRARGLFVGDLVTPTGFSRVLHSLLDYLQNDYIIEGLGVNYRGDPHPYKFPIYPASSLSGNIYGVDRFIELLSVKSQDFIFMLNDPWVLDYYLKAIKETGWANNKELPKIIVYFPVDSDYHDFEWFNNFDLVSEAVTYTEFGKEVLNKVVPKLKVNIIPHGIDSKLFYKKYNSSAEAKKTVFGTSLVKLGDADKLWIVLNANRNQPRKKLDVTMRGFAEFAKDKPKDVKLYMHCGIRDASIDVLKMARRLGMEDRLILSNLNNGVQRLSVERLNDIYNASDIGINTSLGEGWGLTSIEHAVTGAPQIVPDHSACREIFSDCGVITPVFDEPYVFDNTMTEGRLPTSKGVAESLEILYSNKDYANELSERAIKKFSQPEYQWKNIAGQWKEIIDKTLTEENRWK